jgi:hypothetical protein
MVSLLCIFSTQLSVGPIPCRFQYQHMMMITIIVQLGKMFRPAYISVHKSKRMILKQYCQHYFWLWKCVLMLRGNEFAYTYHDIIDLTQIKSIILSRKHTRKKSGILPADVDFGMWKTVAIRNHLPQMWNALSFFKIC